MNYLQEIRNASDDPKQMESLFQEVSERGKTTVFQSDLTALYEEMPENILLAAWYFRLQQMTTSDESIKKDGVNWRLAIPLSIITGLIFWLITDTDGPLFLDHLAYLFIFWSPIATILCVAFLAGTARKYFRRAVFIASVLILVGLYVYLISPGLLDNFQTRYLDLMAIHLPLMSWIALGITVLGLRSSNKDRFSFLIKSIETMITAGLYLIFGMVLGGITIGMFAALNVNISDLWLRLMGAGGFGLLPTLAVATIYDPTVAPGKQDFTQGLSKFIATMMRLLLPLTLAVLVVYVFVIPFNFMEPFEQRDVLIVYNVMLFAIMGLLMGATPIRKNDLSQPMQGWLRSGILAIAILGTLISIYAMSATVYRAVQWGITINRLTVIGWNTINIGILIALIVKQFKDGVENWVESLQQVFSFGTNCYVAWGLFLVVAIPLLFR